MKKKRKAKVISIVNQKGGVGKTTIAFNLAVDLARDGYKVLAIDNDQQGNLTGTFIDDPSTYKCDIIDLYEGRNEIFTPDIFNENLHFVGANIHFANMDYGNIDVLWALREALSPIRSDYDYIVIDSSRSFGLVSRAVFCTTDYVIVPTKPEMYSLQGLNDLMQILSEAKKRYNPNMEILGVVLSMVSGQKVSIEKSLKNAIRETYSKHMFKTEIRRVVSVSESSAEHMSVNEYQPKSKVGLEFKAFYDEIMERLNG